MRGAIRPPGETVIQVSVCRTQPLCVEGVDPLGAYRVQVDGEPAMYMAPRVVRTIQAQLSNSKTAGAAAGRRHATHQDQGNDHIPGPGARGRSGQLRRTHDPHPPLAGGKSRGGPRRHGGRHAPEDRSRHALHRAGAGRRIGITTGARRAAQTWLRLPSLPADRSRRRVEEHHLAAMVKCVSRPVCRCRHFTGQDPNRRALHHCCRRPRLFVVPDLSDQTVVVLGLGPTKTSLTAAFVIAGLPPWPGPTLRLYIPFAWESRRSKARQIASEDRTEFSRSA